MEFKEMNDTLLYSIVQVFNVLLLVLFFYLYRNDKPLGKLFYIFEDNYVIMFILYFIFAALFTLLSLRVIYFIFLTLDKWGVV